MEIKRLHEPAKGARAERLLMLAPHPDDETLVAGGMLARAVQEGQEVWILYVTSGDNNPWMQRIYERRWRVGTAERERYGELRRREAAAATARLGIAPERLCYLGWRDQELTDRLVGRPAESVAALAEFIARVAPDRVLAPSMFDAHPDHSALAVLARLAIDTLEPERRPDAVWSYLCHGESVSCPGQEFMSFALTAEERQIKREAMLEFKSQLAGRKNWLLSRLFPVESFNVDEKPAGEALGHAIMSGVYNEQALWIQVAPRARFNSFGAQRLRVLCVDGEGRVTHLSLELDWSDAAAEVLRDGRPVAQARLAWHRRHGDVFLPAELLEGARRVFVKLERRYGLYDQSGWLELPPPPEPGLGASGAAGGRVVGLIPCYNVAALCGPVVRQAAARVDRLIVVDDGSTDGTREVLEAEARRRPDVIEVIALGRNQGKGAALLHGMRRALERPFEVLVTLDGDGQHLAAEIPRLVAAMRGGADLVLGARGDLASMPLRSRIGNTATGWLFHALDAQFPADTQTGFRALRRGFVREVVGRIEARHYEMELRVLLLALEQRARVSFAPITTIYLDGNRSSHFRPVADSARIYGVLLKWLLDGPHPRELATTGEDG